MLNHLLIQNYALIDKLDIEFSKGLSIITGETGAGKSILLGALSLILGQRADSSVLKDKTKNCVVEGLFSIKDYNLQKFFEDNELDYSEETVIRRIIGENGKSRAFINDVPANLTQIKELTQRLVDIHSQHNNLLLNDDEFQLAIVDSFAKHQALLTEYQGNFLQYRKSQTSLNQLKERAEKEKSDLDYLSFQYDELKKANLKEGEQKELEAEIEILNHAGDIKMALSSLSDVLTGEPFNFLAKTKETVHILEKIAPFFPKATDMKERLNSAFIDLKDLNQEAEVVGQDIGYDPDRAAFISSRLDMIYNLQKKHKVSELEELIEIRNSLEIKIAAIESFDEEIEKLEKQIKVVDQVLSKQSSQITKNRKAQVLGIETKIGALLNELGMPNAKFKVDIQTTENFSAHGRDAINFLFTANKNADLQDVTKVISGGEMSRLMLGLKAIVSQTISLPTIVFDEIDTGVSGDIADRMGNIIKEISGNIQVINITHLPQVAAKGDTHYKVYKINNEESTVTNIKQLNDDERVIEIAKMLSGKELTEAAISNAKSLIGKN
jgi:DNA repair protein RecN (Recombination protein N)